LGILSSSYFAASNREVAATKFTLQYRFFLKIIEIVLQKMKIA
jgi:hypothetical protein